MVYMLCHEIKKKVDEMNRFWPKQGKRIFKIFSEAPLISYKKLKFIPVNAFRTNINCSAYYCKHNLSLDYTVISTVITQGLKFIDLQLVSY